MKKAKSRKHSNRNSVLEEQRCNIKNHNYTFEKNVFILMKIFNTLIEIKSLHSLVKKN